MLQHLSGNARQCLMMSGFGVFPFLTPVSHHVVRQEHGPHMESPETSKAAVHKPQAKIPLANFCLLKHLRYDSQQQQNYSYEVATRIILCWGSAQ